MDFSWKKKCAVHYQNGILHTADNSVQNPCAIHKSDPSLHHADVNLLKLFLIPRNFTGAKARREPGKLYNCSTRVIIDVKLPITIDCVSPDIVIDAVNDLYRVDELMSRFPPMLRCPGLLFF